MGKKKKQDEAKKGLDEWMGTYADMITLLFCFFVLLYATSTQDEVKLQYILQSVSSGGEFINAVVSQNQPIADSDGNNSKVPPLDEGTGGSGGKIVVVGQGNDPDSFETLFNWVARAIDEEGLNEAASLEGTKNKISISLDNDVLFGPDSATLKSSGREVLGKIAPAVKAVQKYISSVQILGHTADVKNSSSSVNDWDLSALRASAVLKYFDYVQMVDSSKMQLEAFAQYRPVADNDTEEGRAKNRRVEIIIMRNPVDFIDGEMMEDILKYDYNQSLGEVDEDGNPIQPPTPTLDSTISAIIAALDKKYSGDSSGGSSSGSSAVGPQVGDNMLEIPDSDYVSEDAEVSDTSAETTAAQTEEAEE